jgi:hypothetical protein
MRRRDESLDERVNAFAGMRNILDVLPVRTGSRVEGRRRSGELFIVVVVVSIWRAQVGGACRS